jgi:hypothetical protein
VTLGLGIDTDQSVAIHLVRGKLQVRPTIDENLYPNPDRKCRRQEEIITELRKKVW